MTRVIEVIELPLSDSYELNEIPSLSFSSMESDKGASITSITVLFSQWVVGPSPHGSFAGNAESHALALPKKFSDRESKHV